LGRIFYIISEIRNLRIAGFDGDTISLGWENSRGVNDYARKDSGFGFCGGDIDFLFLGRCANHDN